MKEAKLTAKVSKADSHEVDFEFGRYQADLRFSASGTSQRNLRLKEGDKVEVIIRKC